MNFERYIRTGEANDFHRALDSSDWTAYHLGQAGQARLIAEEIVSKVPLPRGATQMMDLGGGHGLYSIAFCSRYVDLCARVLDLAIPLQYCPSTVLSNPASNRVTFEIADVRTTSLGSDSADVVLIANLMHHFDEATNRRMFSRVASALRPCGIVIAIDLVRPLSVSRSGQVGSLLDLYFGSASGSQLWTIAQVRDWQEGSGLRPQPSVSSSLLPDCMIQIAQKPG
jgi:cyclopropane fatty-acyl-phospholipid synthase-like methyltransferase